MSSDGYLWFLGRRKDMLKVNGMSVYPSEIEAVLGQHPQVLLCAVVGKPDERLGEKPMAFVCLRPGATTQAQDLVQLCRESLASYKVPEIRVVTEFTMTPTGKVKKEELRNLFR